MPPTFPRSFVAGGAVTAMSRRFPRGKVVAHPKSQSMSNVQFACAVSLDEEESV
jgi:hypothetical protein